MIKTEVKQWVNGRFYKEITIDKSTFKTMSFKKKENAEKYGEHLINILSERVNIDKPLINDYQKVLPMHGVSKPLNVFLVGDNVLFGHKKAKVIWTSVRYVDIQLINGTMYQGVPVSVIRHP